MTTGLTVILTHEHTDFDALASMLAAGKLYPEAYPVLPRQLNRNVREFLTLYRDQLPFVGPHELPARRIDHAILVDTQALAPIRRMTNQTTIHIIDHHEPQRRSLPAGWSSEGDRVGATTTLLVEQLQARTVPLTSIEASCLLLGIYEDTGALTYAATTDRDALAVSYLLHPDRGARVEIVGKFLHHPLSSPQQLLLQQLITNSEPYEFGGQPIIIASAYLRDFDDEISTLAHRVRDLYEPAAVFLLVDLGDRIQIVARSTTDTTDVGHITSQLGGGGHNRAAAALIRGQSLPEVKNRLIELLQQSVRPSITVAEIMSWGVQTLDPDLAVADAAARMERFGFEGYPVADLGKVVGMLTRREVDRALRHRMNQAPVSQIMSRGSHSVTPEDGLDVLQRRMMETGWGQMPVVDRDTGQMIGIVTRTDLIKLWGGESRRVSQADEMSARMQALLPQPLVTLLVKAGEAASQLNFPLYAVGGFVRDLLLNQPNFDIDLVVEGDAIALARLLAQTYGGHVRSHRRFGTAKWVLRAEEPASQARAGHPTRADDHDVEDEAAEEELIEYRDTGNGFDLAIHELPVNHLDFVTARTEFYEHPTALPTVERSSIKLDLHRRDFTINTLAIRLNPERRGELLDFYNGKEDLDNGVIRVLHSLSFVEDPTRILRAVRFEQRFHFQIEPRTEQLIVDALDLLGRVSPARIRHELELILEEQEPERALARLQQMHVLERIDRHLTYDRWIADRFVDMRNARQEGRSSEEMPRLYLALWLYRLDRAADLSVTNRLRLRTDTQRVLTDVRALQRQLADLGRPALRPSEIDTILQPSSAAARLVVRVACESWLVQQRIDFYERNLMHVKTSLDGHRLRALGIPPGPLYRRILTAVRAARLDGTVQTAEEEIALAGEYGVGSRE